MTTVPTISASDVLAGGGAVAQWGLAGGDVVAGQVVYLAAAENRWSLAQADSAVAAERSPKGMALNSASEGQPVRVLTRGPVSVGPVLDPAMTYYLSGDPGSLCQLEDLAEGDYPTIVGIARSASVLDLSIQSSGLALWFDPRTLFDLDDENDRFYVRGETYETLAAAATALGGTNSGQALTLSPHLTGDIIWQSDFSSGIDGFAETLNPDNGSLAAVGGNLEATTTVSSYRFSKQVAANRIAVMARITRVSMTLGSATLTVANNAGLSGAASSFVTMTGNARFEAPGVSDSANVYIGCGTSGIGKLVVTAAELERILPFEGFQQLQHRFEFNFTTLTIGTQQVIEQLGIPSATAQSIRLVIDANGNLRVITTVSNSTVTANLDLGVLEPDTRYKVRGSLADNAFHANLDGGPLVSDTSGGMPASALYWRGRSQSGETFLGTIHRSKVWPAAVSDPNELVDPSRAFLAAGDSIGNGDGATTKWFQGLGSPVRAYHEIAVAGETTAQMLARVQAVTGFYRQWPLLMMDFPNTGESAETWLANIKAAGQFWGDEWFIMPPAQTVGEAPADKIATIQAALLSDPDFDGHTLDAVEQAAYLAEVADGGTRSDNLHFNDTGQAIQRSYVVANRGW